MISFDSLMLNSIITDFFVGARIYKIQQPTRREVILNLRNHGETKQFYINIDPKFYHVCFVSEQNYRNRCIEIPSKPPMFCMLLRKYLNNARIARVNQPEGERIFEIFVETFNEIGDKIYLCLAIELMGKYSNIILYNTDTSIILGCAHNVGADKSSVREVYGTIPYVYPPKQDNMPFLNKRYGFLRACNIDFIWTNEIIDNYFAKLTGHDKFLKTKSELKSQVLEKLNRVSKSLDKMNSQINKSMDGDKYRLWGDLIMANLYNLSDFSSEISVFDYENNKQITIELNSLKTLKENANIFYKKYSKSKNALMKLKELTELQTQEKDYLGQILYSIDAAQNIDDLKDIMPEVQQKSNIQTNYTAPVKIELTGQTQIYIGKNNKQNDYIISKLADEDDLWFHTKDYPGSHVLLKTQNLTDDLILYCAKLARQYSLSQNSGKVGVIYTKRKYLRKPPKANLGYVTYRNEKEILID